MGHNNQSGYLIRKQSIQNTLIFKWPIIKIHISWCFNVQIHYLKASIIPRQNLAWHDEHLGERTCREDSLAGADDETDGRTGGYSQEIVTTKSRIGAQKV